MFDVILWGTLVIWVFPAAFNLVWIWAITLPGTFLRGFRKTLLLESAFIENTRGGTKAAMSILPVTSLGVSVIFIVVTVVLVGSRIIRVFDWTWVVSLSAKIRARVNWFLKNAG